MPATKKAPPDLPVWTRHELLRLKRVVPDAHWITVETWLAVMRQWVAEPILGSRTAAEARRKFDQLVPFIEVLRAGLQKLLNEEQLRFRDRESQLVIGSESDRLVRRARRLLDFEAAVQFEHALRDLATSQQDLVNGVAHVATGSLPTRSMHALWRSATRCDGLLIVTAMAIEGECVPRSKAILVALIRDLSDAIAEHYATAKKWLSGAIEDTASSEERQSAPWSIDWDLEIRQWLKAVAGTEANA